MESTFDYPNLKKAVKLLDETHYTEGQLIAYDNYLASVMSWNSTMIHQYEEGKTEGKVEERKRLIEIIKDLKSGMSVEEIALKYEVEVGFVELLK